VEATLTTPPPSTRARWWHWLGAAPFVLWPTYLLSRGEVRWEALAVMVIVPTLALASARTRVLFAGLLPVGLVALLYDAMRFVKNVGVTPARVHLCDLRAVEMRLFGVTAAGHAGTVHTWFRAHPSALLDALCAVPYGTYIYAVLATAGYLYLRDVRALRRFTWTFFALNVAGFVTYHLWPAAPPWYFHAHGCVVDLGARASEGDALARVDARMGLRYFHGFYGRSNDVFGTMPSLHVAYPALIAVAAWRHFTLATRALVLTYAALMCLGAVYLDHHWILDVLVGLVYAVVAWTLVRRAFPDGDGAS
jgi:inositol phosphorylceramide synthase catalytic subunit